MTTKDYNRCVDAHADQVYRFILSQLRHRENARDVVQSAFEVLWRKRKEVNSEKAKSYLFSVAYHGMIDFIRKDKRTKYTDMFVEYAARSADSAENNYTGIGDALKGGLDRLPEIQKSVLLLRDYEGYSYGEIGEILHLSESQVKVYIFRARKFMQAYVVDLRNVI